MNFTKNIATSCRSSARAGRGSWPSATCSVRCMARPGTSRCSKKTYFLRTSKNRSTDAACRSRTSREVRVFHNISPQMQQVMRVLEEQLERDQRSLRSVDSDVARVLSLLALSAPRGAFLELGSGGGYSSLWLSLAARAKGVTLTTVDLDEKKVALAQTNIAQAGADGSVQVFHGDAFDYAGRSEPLAFCFSDIEPPENNAKIYE